MEQRECGVGLRRPAGYVAGVVLSIMMLLPHTTAANQSSRAYAVPDYGSDDCVSFKQTADINALNFTFGYACVSAKYCEVSTHGCIDERCNNTDYSKGARTALANVPLASRIDKIILGASGEDLASDSRWCLVKDGGGNFWALDKLRGQDEKFTLTNQHETVIPCEPTDYFRSDLGCVKDIDVR